MLARSILAVLVLPHATYAHSPPQPSLSPPRSGQPTLKASGKEEATKRTALLAQAKPAAPANRVTDIAAGTYSGLVAGFLNCVVVASIVFEPIGLPLSIAVQHALVGFVITQLVVTKLTGVGALLTVPSFEALPFMARYAVLVSNALGPDQMPSILATLLAGCLAVSHPTSRALWLQPGMIGLQDRTVAAWNRRVAARAPMVADEPARLCDARCGLGLAGGLTLTLTLTRTRTRTLNLTLTLTLTEEVQVQEPWLGLRRDRVPPLPRPGHVLEGDARPGRRALPRVPRDHPAQEGAQHGRSASSVRGW